MIRTSLSPFFGQNCRVHHFQTEACLALAQNKQVGWSHGKCHLLMTFYKNQRNIGIVFNVSLIYGYVYQQSMGMINLDDSLWYDGWLLVTALKSKLGKPTGEGSLWGWILGFCTPYLERRKRYKRDVGESLAQFSTISKTIWYCSIWLPVSFSKNKRMLMILWYTTMKHRRFPNLPAYRRVFTTEHFWDQLGQIQNLGIWVATWGFE